MFGRNTRTYYGVRMKDDHAELDASLAVVYTTRRTTMKPKEARMQKRAIPKPKAWEHRQELHEAERERHMARARYYVSIGDTERAAAQVKHARHDNHSAIAYRKMLSWWS